MVSILTGDVVHSRKISQDVLVKTLTEALGQFGKSPKTWEIYRGDSFQLEVEPTNALEAAIYIKSALRKLDKNLDARISIGIGDKSFEYKTVSMSNGSAFINSGESFENLKKQTLAIKTPWQEFDKTMTVILALIAFQIENWNANLAYTVFLTLQNPHLSQTELALKTTKQQSQISRELKKAGFEEILKAIQFYKSKISDLC